MPKSLDKIINNTGIKFSIGLDNHLDYFFITSFFDALYCTLLFGIFCYFFINIYSRITNNSIKFFLKENIGLLLIIFTVLLFDSFMFSYFGIISPDFVLKKFGNSLFYLPVNLLLMVILLIFYIRIIGTYKKQIMLYTSVFVIFLMTLFIGILYHHHQIGFLIGGVSLLLLIEFINCLFEQLFFTRTIYNILLTKYYNLPAVLITTLFFFSFHDIWSLQRTLIIFFTGILHCLLYYKYRRLSVPFFAHFIYNVLVHRIPS